ETEPVFREAIDACRDVLRGPLGLDLQKLVFASGRDAEEAGEALRQTRLTQPALFAIEYALARLWRSFGVAPAAMIGPRVGEDVGACLPGVSSLEAARVLVAERGRLMQGRPRGGMLAVPLGEAALQPHLDADLDIASLNPPSASVVSGPSEAVARLAERL